jgi:hypothetical protein
MRVVHKFPLLMERATELEIPLGAQLLHAAWQQGAPTLWFLVDPTQGKERRLFVIVATGETLHYREGSLAFVGTVLTPDGRFVWHIFERKE